jgi:histone H3/H4
MEFWRPCSSCKKEIPFSAKYYECSVSTCTGKRTGYVFCSIHCFERHLPGAKHRDAAAIEMMSPTKAQAALQEAVAPQTTTVPGVGAGPTRRIIPSSSQSTTSASKPSLSEDEILIVISKLKNYIREKSEMNTSGDVAEILSHIVRRFCDEAINNARQDGRKTVMARDFSS